MIDLINKYDIKSGVGNTTAAGSLLILKHEFFLRSINCDLYRKLIDIKSVSVGTTNTPAHTSYTAVLQCCTDTADTEVESN